MDASFDTALGEIAGRFELALIVQFGSTVGGPTHARSDVDVAVKRERGRPPLSFREHAELAHALGALFPGREVDLAALDRADPLFLKQVLLGRCRLLFGSQRRFAEQRLLAYKRYQDHRRYLELERRYVDRVLRACAQP